MEGIFKGILRILATVIGVIGAIVALIVNGAHSIISDASKGFGHSHGFIGLGLVAVGLVGALVSLPFPVTAAVLMVVAAVGLFFVVGASAFFAIPLLVIAAILAFLDRKGAKKASAT